MSYFRLAVSPDSDEDSPRGDVDECFLQQADRDSSNRGAESEDELYVKRRTDHEATRRKAKQLIFFLGVAVTLIVFMALLLIWQHFITIDTPCVSPACVESAGYLVAKMDFTVDPCDDFYSYACAGWVKAANPPPDKAKWSTFSDTYKKNSAIIKKALEKNGSLYLGQPSRSIEKTKHYFQLCMDEKAVEKRGITPALQLIRELGSWTITSDAVSGVWVGENWKPLDTIIAVHKYNHDSLFSMALGVDNKDSSNNIIQFEQAGLTLASREEYLEKSSYKFREAFLRYGTRFGQLLGGGNDTQDKIEAVYQFEKELAQIFIKDEDLIDPQMTYHKMTVAQFQDLIGETIPVKTYLESMLNGSVPDSENVIVYTPEYFRKLGPLMKKTKPEVLANYLLWSLLQVMPAFLPSAFKEASLELDKVERGVMELGPVWSRCVTQTDGTFGFATGALYVEDPQRFPPDTKEVVKNMLDSMRQTFIKELPNVDWMEASVQGVAMDKASAITNKVAYPDWIRSVDKLDNYYDKLNVTDDFFESMLNVRVFYQQRNMNKRGKPPDSNEWHQTPTTVNAYYSSSHNYFAFPAGILQKPFYDSAFPMSYNFGAIGFVMGHELTHGFDNVGRRYDKHGNLENWWTNQSAAAFSVRSQCMEDQYYEYKIQKLSVNGKKTLGENIADNGGVKVAFQAYQNWLQNNKAGPQLPGLPPDDLKLFFLGFAQVWCSYYTPAYARQALLTDSHSPAKYRVIGTLSNSQEFSDTFGCQKGKDRMNPQNKCAVW